jgi:hypothetical protein
VRIARRSGDIGKLQASDTACNVKVTVS